MKADKTLYRVITIGLWAVLVFLLWLQRVHVVGVGGATVFTICIFIPTIAEVHVLSNFVMPRVRGTVAGAGWFVAGTLLTALAWGGIIALLRRAEGWPLCAGLDLVSSGGSFWQDAVFALPSVTVFNLGFCGLRLYFEQRKAFAGQPEAKEESAGMQVEGDTIFVKEGEALVQVRVDDILYIEGMQNYVKIHALHQTVVTLQTLTALENMLSGGRFFRTHKSFIVNVARVEKISSNRLVVGGQEVPLSPGKKDELFARFVSGKLVSK